MNEPTHVHVFGWDPADPEGPGGTVVCSGCDYALSFGVLTDADLERIGLLVSLGTGG